MHRHHIITIFMTKRIQILLHLTPPIRNIHPYDTKKRIRIFFFFYYKRECHDELVTGVIRLLMGKHGKIRFRMTPQSDPPTTVFDSVWLSLLPHIPNRLQGAHQRHHTRGCLSLNVSRESRSQRVAVCWRTYITSNYLT